MKKPLTHRLMAALMCGAFMFSVGGTTYAGHKSHTPSPNRQQVSRPVQHKPPSAPRPAERRAERPMPRPRQAEHRTENHTPPPRIIAHKGSPAPTPRPMERKAERPTPPQRPAGNKPEHHNPSPRTIEHKGSPNPTSRTVERKAEQPTPTQRPAGNKPEHHNSPPRTIEHKGSPPPTPRPVERKAERPTPPQRPAVNKPEHHNPLPHHKEYKGGTVPTHHPGVNKSERPKPQPSHPINHKSEHPPRPTKHRTEPPDRHYHRPTHYRLDNLLASLALGTFLESSDVGIIADNVDENYSDFAEQVLTLVNYERSQRGISPLRLSRELMNAAAIRADEITRVFSHTRPNGQPCSSLIRDGAYTVGENIATGAQTPEAVVEQWMNSPGHRANILNGDYEELGVGYAYAPNSEYQHYWVQMFRRPMSKAVQY